MNFSNALALMDSGFRCTRQEWKAKGNDVWVGMVHASQPITIYNMPKSWLDSGKDNSRITFGDWIGVKTANDIFIPWEAAQSDVFASDWTVYDLVVGDNHLDKQIVGAEVAPKTTVNEISAPTVDTMPRTAIGEAYPVPQVAAEISAPDIQADATRFVKDNRSDTKAKHQREAEKAAMKAKVAKAMPKSTPKPSAKPTTKTTSHAESEKAAMRARMNKALNKR